MVVLTPKQEEVLDYVLANQPISSIEVGVAFGKPRKLSERWATPPLRILVKHKKLVRNDDGTFSGAA